MINRRGQEAGQAISTLVTFFIILVLLVVFYWISSAAALFVRGVDASSMEYYSGPVGNPDLLSLPSTQDSFLKRPAVIQFADGDVKLVSMNTLIALYRSDNNAISDIEKNIEKEPTQSGKDILIKERTLASLHSLDSRTFEESLINFLIKQSEANYCLVLGQDIGRDLSGRLNSQPNYYDFFLKNVDGSKVEKFRIYSGSPYLLKLSKYTYTSVDGEVIVEYYYGPCLGGDS